MAQRNVTTSGSHLAKALVSPTGGAADETLADIAQAALSIASTDGCGRVELATADETAAGTDATRAVTPAGLAAQNYIRSTDVTYKALNDNGHVGTDASQVSRGDHGHSDASSTAAGFMSIADKMKLDGIESGATADQTGAEIVTAINTELGGTHWQQGGGGSDRAAQRIRRRTCRIGARSTARRSALIGRHDGKWNQLSRLRRKQGSVPTRPSGSERGPACRWGPE